ncbi:MAG: DNA translocase FtsK [Chloroflexota bacterium]
MARKKASTPKRPARPTRARAKPKSGGLSHLLWRAPVRNFILLVLAVALLFWQRQALVDWATSVRNSLLSLFGWGLAFIIIAIVILVTLISRRRLTSLIYRWNRWLGGVAFTLAAWGLLAMLQEGGRLGLRIIGYPDFGGVLRIVGLVLIGAILASPRACYHGIARFFRAIGRLFSQPPAPRPARREKAPAAPPVAYPPPVPEATAPPVTEAAEPAPGETEVTTTAATAPAASTTREPRQLRQVAQEVWKKYGESPHLVTVDGWRLPPIDILDRTPEIEFSQADNMQRARIIEEALASYGVETRVVQINAGPTVTQFGVEPGWDRKIREVKERDKDGNISIRTEEVSKTRVKVERITSLANDLSLALAAPSIRMEAPVPGKSVVGIEVPNTTLGMVSLRGVIESASFQKQRAKSRLALALGKGAGGEAVVGDLARMPHLLIAGATGSGKTVCLNSIICCLLLHNAPSEIRFILVDPKRVELTPYNSIPHLATPVIVDANKAVSTLRWLNQEMDKRYQKLAAATARNIDAYNKTREGDERMPYLVLVIDELADLMMTGFDEVEHILCRLAQLARATGIHLVVATQRPSVDVVTGLIKANFPTRISFAVTSQVDSRTILDGAGAEKLLGRGDMLYLPTEAGKPKRLQGCYVSDPETERLVYFWGGQKREEKVSLELEEFMASPAATKRNGQAEDPLLDTARELAREHKHISTSFLQRRLRIGYPRAARLMEQLEAEGIGGEEGE